MARRGAGRAVSGGRGDRDHGPGRLRLSAGAASLEELGSQTLLVREPGSSTRAIAERHLARVGYRPAKRWSWTPTKRSSARSGPGFGIGFVSRLVVEEELARGELEAFAVEGAGAMRRSVYLIRADGREPVPAERAFIQTQCSCCSASVAGCSV